MSESEEFIFNDAYCGRVKRFREETNMSAADMADILGIPADRYRKYETRSPLPVYLIAKFCKIVGCDLEHLVIGKPRERLKPSIIARKVIPAPSYQPEPSDDDLVRKTLEAERIHGARAKLDQFVEAIASQQNKTRNTGT